MHPFSNEEIELLSRKYKEGTLTPEEETRFIQWYSQLVPQLEHSEAANVAGIKERILQKTYKAIGVDQPLPALPGRQRRFTQKYAYLATAILFFTFGISVLYYMVRIKSAIPAMAIKTSVVPGSDKAILVLGNGKTIDLTAAPNGNLSIDGGTVLTKQKAGEVEFAIGGKASGRTLTNQYNAIQIPKGGQWKLTLQDGTKVWLNAATFLRFPTTFTGKTREIYLEGEGYFEIAQDVAHPFIVHAGSQTVEVLGTHFNINAYKEEKTTQTTLLEGAVSVNGSSRLMPGQKAVSSGNSLKVESADVEQVIAWKEGRFIFGGEDLAGIMRQVSRWYNVEVKFESPELKAITFSGSVSRSIPFPTLIHRLSMTKEVSFTMKNNTVIVQPYHTTH